jgi:hypothetical protein
MDGVSNKPTLTEHQHQADVISWAALQAQVHPEQYGALRWLYATPNGAWLAGNQRQRIGQWRKLVNEGVKKGVPDLCLPVARRGYHGCYIEMKRSKREKPSAEQTEWIAGLTNEGYCARVCYGADEAIELLTWYMEANDEN